MRVQVPPLAPSFLERAELPVGYELKSGTARLIAFAKCRPNGLHGGHQRPERGSAIAIKHRTANPKKCSYVILGSDLSILIVLSIAKRFLSPGVG